MKKPLIGGFTSSSGGVQNAVIKAKKEGFNTVMFSIGSPHRWKEIDMQILDKVILDYTNLKTFSPTLNSHKYL